jgi:hypothetical protein
MQVPSTSAVPHDSGHAYQLWSYLMTPVVHIWVWSYHAALVVHPDSRRTSRFRLYIPTPVAHIDSSHTSWLRSYITALVVHIDSSHTSQLWSYILTPVIHRDSSCTSQLWSRISTVVVPHDFGHTSWLRLYIPDSGHTLWFRLYILTPVVHIDSGRTSYHGSSRESWLCS